jgi:protein phosphatase
VHGKELWQVTTDHTWLQRRIEAGELVGPRARASGADHTLWNVIGGGHDEVLTDIYRVPLVPGDSVLFCTDGLTHHVSDEAIARELAAASSAEDACRRLVDAAIAGGGSDNVTVVVARVPRFNVAPGHEVALALAGATDGEATSAPRLGSVS